MKSHFVALAALSCSLVALGFGLLFTAFLTMIPHTNKGGAEIRNAFETVAAFVDRSIHDTKETPTNEAWRAFLATERLPRNRWLDQMDLITYPDLANYRDLSTHFDSRPPPGSYALRLWRGEWHEFYASWTRKSTVPSALENYAWTGIPAALFLSVGVLGLRWSNRMRRRANTLNFTRNDA